LLLGIQTLQQS